MKINKETFEKQYKYIATILLESYVRNFEGKSVDGEKVVIMQRKALLSASAQHAKLYSLILLAVSKKYLEDLNNDVAFECF